MDLHSVLCGSLDGRGVWGRMDTHICMAESLRYSPETTTLLISYTPIQNKKCFKKDVVHIYNGILLSHKKEQYWVICSYVDEPRVCHCINPSHRNNGVEVSGDRLKWKLDNVEAVFLCSQIKTFGLWGD